jgi:hypothetical protein
MQKRAIFLFLVMGLIPAWAWADTIYLHDGTTVEGKIIRENTEVVQINVQGLPQNYRRSVIAKIERTPEPQTPLEKKERTFGEIPEAKRELILRLLDANKTRENMTRIFTRVISEASPEAQEELKKYLLTDKMIERIVPVYDRFYNETELKDLILFYKSPTGQKHIELAPQVLDATMQAMIKFIQEQTKEAETKPAAVVPAAGK